MNSQEKTLKEELFDPNSLKTAAKDEEIRKEHLINAEMMGIRPEVEAEIKKLQIQKDPAQGGGLRNSSDRIDSEECRNALVKYEGATGKGFDSSASPQREVSGPGYHAIGTEDPVNEQAVEIVEDRRPALEYDIVVVRGQEKKRVKQTITNCREAIAFDPDLRGKIRFNEMSYAPYICGQLPWMRDNHPREWNNTDDSFLRQYLERYGLTKADKIADAFEMVVSDKRFNPVRDKLIDIRLNHWDGKSGHIRRLLPDYLGCEDSDYNAACMKLIMIAAIKRVFQPGCKFDSMMILVGPQGLGKSEFIKTLALFPEWCCDNFNSFEPNEAIEKIRGFWIIEVAELLAAKLAREVESIKAFITSTVDVYREPYKKRTERRERQCVFIGTTNSENFLTDKTGNRRFLPIVTGKNESIKSLFDDREKVYADFFNAWGEAMDLYLQNVDVALILPKEAAVEALEMQKRFEEDDPRIGIIQRYLDNRDLSGPVCISEIWDIALGIQDRSPRKSESNELHLIMKQSITGWKRCEKKMRCGKYGCQVAYVRVTESVAIDSENWEQLDFEAVTNLAKVPFLDQSS